MYPNQSFILAAGLGTRMKPLTNTRPKPLMEVNGKTLLDRTLDQLQAAGVEETVINTHYLAQQIHECVIPREAPRVHISYEEQLLDTAGGIKKTLKLFEESFFVLSGDGLWTNGASGDALKNMAAKWDESSMDILMLLQPVSTFTLTKGVGDYDITPDGRAVRSHNKTGAYMFTSMRINHPRIFRGTLEGAFSYLTLLDAAEKSGKLFAMIHDGEWHHISTPQDLEAVNQSFTKRNL